MIPVWEKNRRKTKYCYHNEICRWKSDSFCWNVVEITRGIVLNKCIKKENFRKDLVNIIEINHQINLTSDHSISSNNLFKSHLNAKRFNMLLKLYQLREARWFWFSVCWKGDVNLQGWCEFSFRRKQERAVIINNINRRII